MERHLKNSQTVLKVGRRVRMKRDYITLKAGMEGVVHSIICWTGLDDASVTFSFRNGDTSFNMSPSEVIELMELLP